MDKNEMVKNLRGPYACIGKWLEEDIDFADRFAYMKDADKYDWYQMRPKVTYNEWIICLYKVDNKLYRLDMEDFVVEEVVVAEVLEYNDKYQPIDENENVVPDDKLPNYCDNICCGESDDISCYIYFNLVNN